MLEVLRRSTDWLKGRGSESPRVDAEMLLAHVLGLQRLGLYVHFDRPLLETERARARELLRQRGEGVPVAYLVGEREFWSLTFEVNGAVLVPRPETEVLVELAARTLLGRAAPVFLDVGTGSGCIAVALLHELPGAHALAAEISPAAAEVALRNAARHDVQARLELRLGDLLEPWRTDPRFGHLDAVLSNPPYVVRGDPLLAPDVRLHEPEAALYVPQDADALHFVRRLARDAMAAVAPGGLLAIEVGYGSAEPAAEILRAHAWQDVVVTPDLAGIGRVVSGQRSGGGESGAA